MSVEFSGFDELINDLNNLGNIGNKIGKKAVEEGAKIVLEQQKKDAPRDADNEHGADKLDITEIKKYAKSSTVVAKVGISSENWEEAKHLYFQNYGYELWKNGKMVNTHVGWIDDSFKKCKDKATEKMIEIAKQEIDKIL
ncbi:HK97 gp10 family phage protein [Clostridium saudiense]|uniref:HK97 gp10 family phage protein n=1 Tax=Clostridium saudiense TaxID=1414720 RepID=UPI0018AAD4F8|nr:HK97 gp10 family phage protein [Clostridium saudiense]